MKSKLSTAKKSKTATFSRVFTQNNSTIFLGKSKLNFWTKNEYYEQCDLHTFLHSFIVYSSCQVYCRLVVTTVGMEPDDDGILHKMILDQVAEKDQRFCNDSTVVWEAHGDFLTMTCQVATNLGIVKAVRKFLRHKPGEKRAGSRKMSAPF